MTITRMLAVVGTAVAIFAPSAANAAGLTSTDKITLHKVTMNGSGCPAGTAQVHSSADATALTVTYSAFSAKGTSVRNCQILVQVHVPQGLTYAVHKVDNRGYAYLQQGAIGKHIFSSYFTGESFTMNSKKSFTGPYDDVWQTTDAADALHWAPCHVDRYLSIKNTLYVRGSSADYIDMFSTDTSVSTVFHLAWRSC